MSDSRRHMPIGVIVLADEGRVRWSEELADNRIHTRWLAPGEARTLAERIARCARQAAAQRRARRRLARKAARRG